MKERVFYDVGWPVSPQTMECLIALATVLRENRTLEALNVNRPLLWSVQEEPTDHFTRMVKVGDYDYDV